jgi:sulfur carrier protein ThiS
MKLYLGGYFNFYTKTQQNWLEIELAEPAILGEILESLGIPPAEVHLAARNGELVDPQTTLVRDEDEVRLYPPVGGG